MTRLISVIRAGQVILDEPVPLADGSRVSIAIEEATNPEPVRKLTFGMLNPERIGPFSTGEDFKEARRSLWKEHIE